MVEVDLARSLAHASASRRVINEAAAAVALLNNEVKERIAQGIGIVAKGTPRVAILFSHFSDPSITRMMEKSGLSVPISILDLVSAKFKKSPDFISGKIVARAEMELGMFDGSYGFIKRVTEAIKDSDIDGFIWNYLYNCRPLTQMSHLLKQIVEKETGVPVLSLESDLVDNRTYSKETQRIKVETFAEMLRARQASGRK
jgi:benzoyl-CoA reductase/2-hydroxyglutaryl-CoA dehydratase subunit BcrC/BadD/HgdB